MIGIAGNGLVIVVLTCYIYSAKDVYISLNFCGVNMALTEEFEKQGNWLFRWRSYVPIGALVLFILAGFDSPYLHLSYTHRQIWAIVCLVISLAGLGIRVLTVGFAPVRTSGRNIKRQVADILNTTGMYSIVRHPLYLGNFFIVLGITLIMMTWWLTAIVSLLFWVYYERIMFAEESFLREKFGVTFEEWADRTPAFIPDVRKWKTPELDVSLRTIIRREYTGFFGIIALFTVLTFTGEFIATGKAAFCSGWIILFSASLLFYITVLFFKKKTRLLHVSGR